MPNCYHCGEYVFKHESELVKKFEDELPQPVQEKYTDNFVHATGSKDDKEGHVIVCFKCFGELVHKAFRE